MPFDSEPKRSIASSIDAFIRAEIDLKIAILWKFVTASTLRSSRVLRESSAGKYIDSFCADELETTRLNHTEQWREGGSNAAIMCVFR
jgi:hypothetical protein